jgi:H+/gluconate symporter-like permease
MITLTELANSGNIQYAGFFIPILFALAGGGIAAGSIALDNATEEPRITNTFDGDQTNNTSAFDMSTLKTVIPLIVLSGGLYWWFVIRKKKGGK